jgi:uncharacterized Zn finger protein
LPGARPGDERSVGEDARDVLREPSAHRHRGIADHLRRGRAEAVHLRLQREPAQSDRVRERQVDALADAGAQQQAIELGSGQARVRERPQHRIDRQVGRAASVDATQLGHAESRDRGAARERVARAHGLAFSQTRRASHKPE